MITDKNKMTKQRQKTWHTTDLADIYYQFKTNDKGLTNQEAQRRLAENGKNELKQKKKKTIIRMFLEQFTDPMVIVLLIAAVLSVVLGEVLEAIVILAIVVLNAVISVIQEKKAATALESLRNLSAPTATVVRDGDQKVIPASELVVGDVVYLEDGRVVPADLRLIKANNLKIQESSLTGESLPIEKDDDAALEAGIPLGDRTNMAYSSSVVLYGNGAGIVVATGMDTEVGQVAKLLDDQDDYDTPLKRKLAAVGKTLSVVGLVICVVIFIVGLLHGQDWLSILMIAIALAISVIPEGLPAVSTIVMALGVQRMAKRSALVRKLPVVEALGSATVICSDKTGTLTENRMTVTKISLIGSDGKNKIYELEEARQLPQISDLVRAAIFCNNSTENPEKPDEFIGDPTEGALLSLGSLTGVNRKELYEKYPRMFEQPFDSQRKRMSVIHGSDGKFKVYTKGAVDEMIDLCTQVMTSDGVRDMTDADKKAIRETVDSLSAEALRVLGYAYRDIDVVPENDDADVEKDLIFVGMTGMIDPPRKEVSRAVRTCHTAGIRTIMITGDHKITAIAIAKELEIYQEGNTALSGIELDNMSDEELDKQIQATTVFARVSPSDKLRIIESLQRSGEVVAMTGDGVNDAPALKKADIGVAMGETGTDVAKDASDMILLDDNFTTIEYSVKEGRRIYANIQKVIQFLLTGNISEVIVLFIATLFNWQTPILAVHILIINLATDSLPSVALGIEPSEKNSMQKPPVRSGSLFTQGLVSRVVLHGIFIATITLSAYWIGLSTASYEVAVTMSFLVLATSQLFHAFNVRSATRSFFGINHLKNIWVIISIIASGSILAVIMFVPVVRDILSLVPLNSSQWMWVALLSIAPIFMVDATKLIRFLWVKLHKG